MSINTPTPPQRPILTRAAENGVRLGTVISVMVLSMGLATVFQPLVLLLWGGTIAMPFITYRMLRRSAVTAGGSLSFPEIWAEGIASFFLASLIPAAIAYICLRFVVPTFIADTLADYISALEAMGSQEFENIAETLSRASAAKMPTATDVAANLISFNIFAGTVLSFVVAVPVALTTRRLSAKKE